MTTIEDLKKFIFTVREKYAHKRDQDKLIIDFIDSNILRKNNKNKQLTKSFLVKNKFILVNEMNFVNVLLPSYARNKVLLFFNFREPRGPFLIGYGFIEDHMYYAATLRWIKYETELIQIYEALTGKSF